MPRSVEWIKLTSKESGINLSQVINQVIHMDIKLTTVVGVSFVIVPSTQSYVGQN